MTDKEAMQMALETLDNMVKVDWREWDEFASVEDFVRWAKSRASFTAEALRARLSQPEPAECDGGQCGIGGYCKQCPKTQPDVPETTFGETKPVAWKMKGVPAFATSRPNDTDSIKWDALYTAPPQREWVGLTDKDIKDCLEMSIQGTCRAIEAKLKEKNNG